MAFSKPGKQMRCLVIPCEVFSLLFCTMYLRQGALNDMSQAEKDSACPV